MNIIQKNKVKVYQSDFGLISKKVKINIFKKIFYSIFGEVILNHKLKKAWIKLKENK